MNFKQIITNRFSLLILGMLLIAGNIFAQPLQKGGMQGPPPIPDSCRIVKMVDELSKSLSLDDEQKKRILDLHFDHFCEAKSQMDKNHEKIESLRKEFENQVKSLLTEDQKKEFDEFVKNHAPQQRPPKPGLQRPKR